MACERPHGTIELPGQVNVPRFECNGTYRKYYKQVHLTRGLCKKEGRSWASYPLRASQLSRVSHMQARMCLPDKATTDIVQHFCKSRLQSAQGTCLTNDKKADGLTVDL